MDAVDGTYFYPLGTGRLVGKRLIRFAGDSGALPVVLSVSCIEHTDPIELEDTSALADSQAHRRRCTFQEGHLNRSACQITFFVGNDGFIAAKSKRVKHVNFSSSVETKSK